MRPAPWRAPRSRPAETAQIRSAGPHQRPAAAVGRRRRGRSRRRRRRRPGHACAQLTGVSLTALNPDMAGKVDAHRHAERFGSDPDGRVRRQPDRRPRAGSRTDRSLNAEIRGVLRDNLMTINASSSNSQGLQARAEVTLPTEASGQAVPPGDQPAAAGARPVHGPGRDQALWDLLGSSERSVSGKIDAEGELAGTLADPRLTGRASLEGGRSTTARPASACATSSCGWPWPTTPSTSARCPPATARAERWPVRAGSARRATARQLQAGPEGLPASSTTSWPSPPPAARPRSIAAADGKVKMVGALTIDRADVSARTKTPAGVVSMDVIERNRPGR